MKKFVVKNGIITNIILADDSYTLDGHEIYPADGIEGAIGWAWANGAPVKPVEPPIPEEEMWKRLRDKRNRLLSECDWTQALDAQVDQTAWATYRQELRDLPANTQDPYNPIWPTPPA